MAWQQIIGDIPGQLADEASEFLEELGAVAVTAKPLGEQAAIETVLGEPVLTERAELTGLFPDDQDLTGLIPLIAKRFPSTAEGHWRSGHLADRDWSRTWMDGFEPLQFGGRVWICPSWLTPPDPLGINVVLDPGMAFGTGTHATTALCLEWLSELPLQGTQVVDYGCGSGILAIAAAKLGAAQVWAVDIDPEAWRVTQENAERNGVADRIGTGSPEILRGCGADVLVANVLLQALVELRDTLARLLPTGGGGRIGLSGLLADQVTGCAKHYAPEFDLAEPLLREGWALLHGRRR
jgi:ribosomal protein L11 methyltransferase